MKEISLTQGKAALVDDADFAVVNSMSLAWQARKGSQNIWYASCTRVNKYSGKDECILMHRLILQPKSADLIDHEDHNGLNNQRYNIRVLPRSLNTHNRTGPRSDNKSGCTGVYWNNQRKVWQAEIKWLGQRMYLGQFSSFEEAVIIRTAKENELWETYVSRVN